MSPLIRIVVREDDAGQRHSRTMCLIDRCVAQARQRTNNAIRMMIGMGMPMSQSKTERMKLPPS